VGAGGWTLINASHPAFIVFHTRPSPSSLRNCILEKKIYIYIYIYIRAYMNKLTHVTAVYAFMQLRV